MSFASTVPAHPNSIPQPVMKSLQSWNFKGLREQRDKARSLCLKVQAMHDIFDNAMRDAPEDFNQLQSAIRRHLGAFATKDEIIDLTPNAENIAQIMTHAMHATHDAQSSEDKEFMTRICNEAVSPITLGGIEAHPEKLALVADFLKKNQKLTVSFSCGHPHGADNSADIEKQIKTVAKFVQKHKLKNPITINTVANYAAWMNGDTDTVRDEIASAARNCAAMGFRLNVAMKSLVHASATRNKTYGEDYFRSVYDMTTLVMETASDEGLDNLTVQTGTGLPAREPFNNSVPLDTTYAESAAPLFMAVADFNAAHETQIGVKVAGGLKNEKDVTGLNFIHKYSCETALPRPLTVQTDIHNRANLLGFIRKMMHMGAAPIVGMEAPQADAKASPKPAP